jgi:predicted Zn-dependent peptidase
MWMGESLLGYSQVLNPADMERKVLAVTPEHVQHVACHCLNKGRLGVAVVGPVQEPEVKSWLEVK